MDREDKTTGARARHCDAKQLPVVSHLRTIPSLFSVAGDEAIESFGVVWVPKCFFFLFPWQRTPFLLPIITLPKTLDGPGLIAFSDLQGAIFMPPFSSFF
jgi:hypothetical protein